MKEINKKLNVLRLFSKIKKINLLKTLPKTFIKNKASSKLSKLNEKVEKMCLRISSILVDKIYRLQFI